MLAVWAPWEKFDYFNQHNKNNHMKMKEMQNNDMLYDPVWIMKVLENRLNEKHLQVVFEDSRWNVQSLAFGLYFRMFKQLMLNYRKVQKLWPYSTRNFWTILYSWFRLIMHYQNKLGYERQMAGKTASSCDQQMWRSCITVLNS